jgi:hypothetical protein
MTLIAAILRDEANVSKSDLRAYLAARESISVKDPAFGAVGDGKADDTAAIQKAIDYAIYGKSGNYERSAQTESHASAVFFPQGRYRITDTLHVGYGTTFSHCSLVGEMDQHYPGILPDFNDRPAIAIQGGLNVLITGLHLAGVNKAWIYAYEKNVTHRAERSSWAGPALGPTSLSRHAPYAGIAIDPYAGPQPPGPYPPVRYPAFLGAVQQYRKNISSRVVIDKCRIAGFAVAVVIQPGLADANGDYVSISNSELQHNIIAFAGGNAQARLSNFVNTIAVKCHTVFDTLTFGQQRGNMTANIAGCDFGQCYQIFNVSMSSSKPTAVTNCYAEGLYRIGRISANAAIINPLKFVGCFFDFHQHYNRNEYTPPALLECSPTHMVEFDTCTLSTGPGAMVVIGTARARVIDCMILNGDIFDVSTIGGKIAKTASLGLWDDYSLAKRHMHAGAIRPGGTFEFSGRAAPTVQSHVIDCDFVDVEEHGRRPLPLWTRRYGCNGSGVDYEPSCYAYTRSLREIARNGREYSCVLSPGTPIGAAQIPKGALVVSPTDLYYVKSAQFESSTVRVSLVQLTNVRVAAGVWSVKPGAELKDTHLYFWNCAKYCPVSEPAYLEATAGSDTATLKPLGGGALTAAARSSLAIGDVYDGGPRHYGLASSSLAATAFQSATVTGYSAEKGALRLSSAARLTLPIPYPLFVKVGY